MAGVPIPSLTFADSGPVTSDTGDKYGGGLNLGGGQPSSFFQLPASSQTPFSASLQSPGNMDQLLLVGLGLIAMKILKGK